MALIGLNCKLYVGAAGSLATTEIGNVRDVTLNLEVAEEDATTREAQGWEVTELILFSASLEFQILWKTTDANFTTLRTAFFAKSAVALAALDGAAGQGLDADFKISKFTRTEPIKGIVVADITAKPVFLTRAPTWKV
jgi:hypothetical protein